MKLKVLILSFVTMFCQMVAFAQKPSPLHLHIDLSYLHGLYESSGDFNSSISRNDMNLYGKSLHLSLDYAVTEKFSAGVGIGADRYENPGYNTFPVFALIHYKPLRYKPVDIFSELGYSFQSQTCEKGLMWNIGIGYTKMFKRHFGINGRIGYNLKQFRHDENNFGSRSSLLFGFGVVI